MFAFQTPAILITVSELRETTTVAVLGLGLLYAKIWSSPYKISSYDEELGECVKHEISSVAEAENKQVAAW